MGKDQELLEAARNGNVLVVEKILNQRAKRSGPLASLRRGPGANVQDTSGYTPLHHAALNGHKEIVRLLLEHEASPNVPDTKGSSPLHLAAWAGHTDIVRLLLTHGPAFTNVNLATRDNETALHCAAQYGHTAVVSMLLNHGADPTVRSSRDESALDLACQYGRIETVELLVRMHPELLEPYRTSRGFFPHTPLHRASRNGHRLVVDVLLSIGHAPNARTPSGTALHEAALCGKMDVVRALLIGGADPRARDTKGATVLDVLSQFPERATHEIVKLINKYRSSNGIDSDPEDLPPIPVSNMIDGPDSPYDNVRTIPSTQTTLQGRGRSRGNQQSGVWERRDEDERRVSATSNISIGSDGGHYPYSRSQMMDGSYHSEELSSSYQSGRVREADQLSISSTTSSTGGPSPRERQRCGTNDSSVSGGNSFLPTGSSGYYAHSPGSNSKVSPTPPKKPPRRNLSVSPTHLLPPLFPSQCGSIGNSVQSHHLARAHQTRSQDDLDDIQAGGSKLTGLRHGRSVDQYVDNDLKTSPRARPIPQPRPSLALLASKRDQPVAISTMYENVIIKEQNPKRKLRRNQYENYHPEDARNQRYNSSQERSSLESLLDDVGSNHGGTPSDVESRPCRNRPTIQTPLSPTHYEQPPTPEHPPPSAKQAELSIHEKMRPLSQVSMEDSEMDNMVF